MCALDDDMPPFRTVFPFNQPPTLVRFDMIKPYRSRLSTFDAGRVVA